MRLFGLYFYNDIKHVRTEEESVVHEVVSNSHTSLTYLLLLISAIIICTLGLLIDSSAVIIGGMIIAPLMWPLMKTALSISYERPGLFKEGLATIVFSTALSILSAYLITLLSPLKTLTTQILLRTSPTPMDLIIAIVAGGVAALAIMRPKIASSLGGVAISASLIPPLCVVGIGLALGEISIALNSLLLFLSNVEAMIFSGLLLFYVCGIRRTSESGLKKKGGFALFGLIVLTIFPLYSIFTTYTLETTAYSKVESVLMRNLSEISDDIVLSQLKTQFSRDTGKSTISVQAQLFIPRNSIITDEQQQKLVENLESELDAEIDLNLQLQNLISIKTNADLEQESRKAFITEELRKELLELSSTITIDSIQASLKEDNTWKLTAVIFAHPDLRLDQTTQEILENQLLEVNGAPVELQLEIIPRKVLLPISEIVEDNFRREFLSLIRKASIRVEPSVTFLFIEPERIFISAQLVVPNDIDIEQLDFESIQAQLADAYSREVDIDLTIIESSLIRL